MTNICLTFHASVVIAHLFTNFMQKDINYYFILFFLFCLAAGHQFKFPDQITSRFLRDTRISNQGKVYISYILVWF